MTATNGIPGAVDPLDRRDRSWWVDWIAKAAVFGGGVSAIVFIAGIFLFIATQGLDFAVHRLSWSQFFGSGNWRPTGHPPEFGALYLIVGTATIDSSSSLVWPTQPYRYSGRSPSA